MDPRAPIRTEKSLVLLVWEKQSKHRPTLHVDLERTHRYTTLTWTTILFAKIKQHTSYRMNRTTVWTPPYHTACPLNKLNTRLMTISLVRRRMEQRPLTLDADNLLILTCPQKAQKTRRQASLDRTPTKKKANTLMKTNLIALLMMTHRCVHHYLTTQLPFSTRSPLLKKYQETP